MQRLGGEDPDVVEAHAVGVLQIGLEEGGGVS